jgi:hypothetical protein
MVYRLRKALYGLKQAPRAWYGHLRGFLFSKGVEMGKFDKTLFLLRQGDDILIVQVYVDDIVFGGSFHSLVSECSHVPLMCDSRSAISVAKNPVLHSRTKHIKVRYHFLRDNVEKGNIDLIHVSTEKQLADILTKPLDKATFARLRGVLGVVFSF